MPLFNQSTGRPLIVDEMDQPILNLGSGDQALRPNEHFMGPRGPVINVDLAQQPTLQQTGREIDPLQIPQHGILPEIPLPQDSPLHMQGNATNLQQLRQLSPTGRFREIHAVNPYGFQPQTTLPLLDPSGSMHITGQNTNQFAQPTPEAPNSTRRNRVFQPLNPALSYSSTPQGQMRAEHAQLNHNLTNGTPLDVTRSTTHTIQKKQ